MFTAPLFPSGTVSNKAVKCTACHFSKGEHGETVLAHGETVLARGVFLKETLHANAKEAAQP
jgi:hypothetical protein